MDGSAALAIDIALWSFWILLVPGWLRRALSLRQSAVFMFLWLIGFAGTRSLLDDLFFAPYVALLDIGLVLAVFKGDIRLT